MDRHFQYIGSHINHFLEIMIPRPPNPPKTSSIQLVVINRWWCYNFWEIYVHRNICITKLWYLSSYFLYLNGFLSNTVFHLEQYCFSRTDIFRCSFHVSNLIQTFQTDWVEYSTQYGLVIKNSCSYRLSCILSHLL